MSRNQSSQIVASAVAYIQSAAQRLQASKFSETAIGTFRSNISGQLKRASFEMVRLGWTDGNGKGDAPNDIATRYVNEQLHFLEGWCADIAQQGKLPGGVGRASMYGESLGQCYQRAYMAARSQRDQLPEMPAYPRDGSTQCITHCRCQWRFKKVSSVYYEATWKLGKAEHCKDCIERADLWGPLSIIRQRGRGEDGQLVVGDWIMSDTRGRAVESA
jgi:hypothetical protein